MYNVKYSVLLLNRKSMCLMCLYAPQLLFYDHNSTGVYNKIEIKVYSNSDPILNRLMQVMQRNDKTTVLIYSSTITTTHLIFK